MSPDVVLGWALQTSLAVSLLVIFILCIRRFVARWLGASAAYALWLLPFIRLFMPPVIIPSFIANLMRKPSELPPVKLNPENIPIPTLPRADIAATPVEAGVQISIILIGIWLAIAVAWLGYQMLRHLHQIQDLRLKTEPVSADLKPAIDVAMSSLSLRQSPEIRMSPDGLGPMVTRFWRPIIVLPQDFAQQYNQAQQNFALVHEMAHIKRFDLWTAFLVLSFRALNWPNPLIHYAAHKFRVDQEAACDAYLLAKLGTGADMTDASEMKQDYARTLIQAAKHIQTPVIHAPLGLALSDNLTRDNDIKGEKNETT